MCQLKTWNSRFEGEREDRSEGEWSGDSDGEAIDRGDSVISGLAETTAIDVLCVYVYV